MTKFAMCAVLALALASALVAAPPANTTTSITLSPGGSVVQFSTASAIGTTVVTSSNAPVTAGNLELQQAADVNGNRTSCSSATQYLPGTPTPVGTDGSATFLLDTSVLGTFGYRIHYTNAGGGFANSFSDCADLTVTPSPCSGVQISADFASGNGNPPAGTPQTWTVEIKVHACEDATGLKAQGGSNAWATTLFGLPSVGDLSLKSTGKNNQVATWTMSSLDAGQDATLLLNITGTIKAKTASGTVLGLTGPWSVVYSTDGGVTYQKSDYTGSVTVTVQ